MDSLAQKVREGEGKKIEMYCHLQELTLRWNMLLGDNSTGSLVFFACLKNRVSAFDPNYVFKDI